MVHVALFNETCGDYLSKNSIVNCDMSYLAEKLTTSEIYSLLQLDMASIKSHHAALRSEINEIKSKFYYLTENVSLDHSYSTRFPANIETTTSRSKDAFIYRTPESRCTSKAYRDHVVEMLLDISSNILEDSTTRYPIEDDSPEKLKSSIPVDINHNSIYPPTIYDSMSTESLTKSLHNDDRRSLSPYSVLCSSYISSGSQQYVNNNICQNKDRCRTNVDPSLNSSTQLSENVNNERHTDLSARINDYHHISTKNSLSRNDPQHFSSLSSSVKTSTVFPERHVEGAELSCNQSAQHETEWNYKYATESRTNVKNCNVIKISRLVDQTPTGKSSHKNIISDDTLAQIRNLPTDVIRDLNSFNDEEGPWPLNELDTRPYDTFDDDGYKSQTLINLFSAPNSLKTSPRDQSLSNIQTENICDKYNSRGSKPKPNPKANHVKKLGLRHQPPANRQGYIDLAKAATQCAGKTGSNDCLSKSHSSYNASHITERNDTISAKLTEASYIKHMSIIRPNLSYLEGISVINPSDSATDYESVFKIPQSEPCRYRCSKQRKPESLADYRCSTPIVRTSTPMPKIPKIHYLSSSERAIPQRIPFSSLSSVNSAPVPSSSKPDKRKLIKRFKRFSENFYKVKSGRLQVETLATL